MSDDEIARLRSDVFQALGAASMCWEKVSLAGVFQSDRCAEIGDELWAKIGRLLDERDVLIEHVESDLAYGVQGGPVSDYAELAATVERLKEDVFVAACHESEMVRIDGADQHVLCRDVPLLIAERDRLAEALRVIDKLEVQDVPNRYLRVRRVIRDALAGEEQT